MSLPQLTLGPATERSTRPTVETCSTAWLTLKLANTGLVKRRYRLGATSLLQRVWRHRVSDIKKFVAL